MLSLGPGVTSIVGAETVVRGSVEQGAGRYKIPARALGGRTGSEKPARHEWDPGPAHLDGQ